GGLGMLLFLAAGGVAPTAIWGLALLLAILNAALFVESAAGRMPAISIVGGVLSWIVLAIWWWRAAAVVGPRRSDSVTASSSVSSGICSWASWLSIRNGHCRRGRCSVPWAC